MKLSEFKRQLSALDTLSFAQPDGELVPLHFHITEVGLITKNFIDCGGDVHTERLANFQIWVANDTHHRLEPKSLLKIIDISNKVLGNEDMEVEIEYQTDTIGRYALEKKGDQFVLVPKQTDCLAKSKCDVPQPKRKVQLSEIASSQVNSCTPGSGCC